MRHVNIVIVLIALSAVAPITGCSEPGGQTPSPGGAGADLPPAASFYRGDKGMIEITIAAPEHLYLSGPEPLVVNLPQSETFKWEAPQAKLTKPVFPMLVPFETLRTAPTGRQDLKLGLKITYCNKADDVCVFKNDLASVPIEILPGGRQGGPEESVIIPLVYELSDKRDETKK